MGKRKSGRNVHGIILLDKCLGVSSNKALQEVRRLFNANKAGHTGSLDPLATGLLPLCFGEATKVSALMLDDDKRYEVVIRLGVMTDTGDAEGQVIEITSVPDISAHALQECLTRFTGEIHQIPPMYSALKHNGKKLYELAREGITLERKARDIKIYEINLLDFSGDFLKLDVFCSKGTYIRSLAEDIGRELGCCGTVSSLRRLQAGQFNISNAKTYDQLSEMDEKSLFECLLNVDQPLIGMPILELTSEQAFFIKQGQALTGVAPDPGMVRLYHADTFLGLGEMQLDGKLAPKKLFNLNS